MSQASREIKHKSIFLVYLYSIITFGIYSIVWTVKSKRDMNALGAEIPTSWYLIIPGLNLFWLYKYSEGFATHIKKDDGTMKWFAIQLFFGIVMPAIVQGELNKHATVSTEKTAKPVAA